MSNTSWTRLQPVTRDVDMQNSLEAALHDPLWMLARQWMLGEFQGEDAGSPALVELKAASAPLVRYTPSPGAPGAAPVPYNAAVQPLEALVERERVRVERGSSRRLAAEAGLHFLRLLTANKVPKYRAPFVEAYPLRAPDAGEQAGIDGASLRFLGVLGNRVPDGATLYAALKSAPAPRGGGRGLPPSPVIAAADRAKVVAAVEAWLDWYDGGLFDEPPAPVAPAASPSPATPVAPTTAWRRDRLEYEFTVDTGGGTVPVVLAAPEYTEGHLDWHAFDVRSAAPRPPRIPPGQDPTHVLLPTPVTYRGMPASRYWEFEDARVNLSAVHASTTDVGRLLMLEFALVYGNDWYVVPVELDVGSVCRVEWLTVTNTFGERTEIRPYHETPAVDSDWAMFTPALDRRVPHGPDDARPLLVLPPALAASLHSAPIEEVLFVRDEMANLGWAVERVVESASGRPLNRYEQALEQRRRATVNAPVQGASGTMAYELGTEVPANWIPLVPVEVARGVMQFRRGRMGTGGSPAPLGRILEGETQLTLQEEEVPRAGARVSRAWQYARWVDGSTHLWIGRRKVPGRGEASSNLQFDRIRPLEASE